MADDTIAREAGKADAIGKRSKAKACVAAAIATSLPSTKNSLPRRDRFPAGAKKIPARIGREHYPSSCNATELLHESAPGSVE